MNQNFQTTIHQATPSGSKPIKNEKNHNSFVEVSRIQETWIPRKQPISFDKTTTYGFQEKRKSLWHNDKDQTRALNFLKEYTLQITKPRETGYMVYRMY